MEMKWAIAVALCLTTSSVEGAPQYLRSTEGMLNGQIVARFPSGVFKDEYRNDQFTCTESVMEKMKLDCLRKLPDNAAAAERLACALLGAPYQPSPIPIGMFKTTFQLGSDINNVKSSDMTPIFNSCALPQMIEDGCFNFMPDVWEGGSEVRSYTTKDEFVEDAFEASGIDTTAHAGIGGVAIRAGISSEEESESSKGSYVENAKLSRSWYNNIGSITIGKCGADYLLDEIIDPYDDWINGPNEDFMDLVVNQRDDFVKMMNDGLMIPTTWEFAIQFETFVETTYVKLDESSSSHVQEAFTIALDNDYVDNLEYKTSLRDAVRKNMDSSVHADVSSDSWSVGKCDFSTLEMGKNSDSISTLQNCAVNTIKDLLSLPTASRVPKGGYRNILDMVTEVIGANNEKSNLLVAAAKVQFGYCGCNKPSNAADNTYKCYLGDGKYLYSGSKPSCTSTTWWLRTDEKFIQQLAIIETAAVSK